MRIRKAYTPELKPEKINRGYAGPFMYRVFEVYVYGVNGFSMLFQKEADAEAVADWHNDNRTFWDKTICRIIYKVRERRVYHGVHYAQTTSSAGLIDDTYGVKPCSRPIPAGACIA